MPADIEVIRLLQNRHGACSRPMLKRSFFERDPVSCARDLIGCKLNWGALSGTVVETEAYDAEGDAASHTSFRPSARAFIRAHRAGAAYVYFSYGVHWMLNVLVKGTRLGFVLIRALEPIDGIRRMEKSRNLRDPRQLCSGPGKLTQALGITGAHHGRDLCRAAAFSFSPPGKTAEVETSPRIGISRSAELAWRFYVPGNPHVSRSFRVKDRAGSTPARS
jgi:DNA-3-methyladenine glycosylase